MSKDKLKVIGKFRVNVTEDGEDGVKIVGDSGWINNQVTNVGFDKYLVRAIAAESGSLQVSHMALGTGGAPATGDTSLAGEVEVRASVTTSNVSSKTERFTATFASSDSFVTDTQNISNAGLFNSSSSGSIFAGNTYASSSVATNQNVNATYEIQFS